MAEPTKKVEEICHKSNGSGTYIRESQNVGELIFEFFDGVEDGLSSSAGSSSSDSCKTNFDGGDVNDEEEEDDENGCSKAEAAKAFWNSQEELLLATLRRTTNLESRIRKATQEVLMELNSVGISCGCRKRVPVGCRECTRKEVCDRLQKDGFSCTICKSKWRNSPEIPAGEHTYLEVVQNPTSTKNEVKVIIELNFKSEFKMGRACEEYDRLINLLPDVYVGKTERLKALLKILCQASKKCMKKNNMHMAPWRKHKYMQAKWLGKPGRPSGLILPPRNLDRSSRPKTSMLSFELLDNLPSLHQATLIKVV